MSQINLPNMAVYQQKNAKHVSFSCKCLQFLQEKHVLCCECQYIFYGHWPCCIQMDSIDSFKFLMRIILVAYLEIVLLPTFVFPHSGQVTVTFWPRFHRTVTGAILNVRTCNRNCDCNCYCTEIST